MKEVSAFYASFYARPSFIKQFFLGIFWSWGWLTRLLLEVFLRNKMGERYFSLTFVLIQFAGLFYVARAGQYGRPGEAFRFILWDIFAFAFLAAGLYRKWELRRPANLYELSRFSKSTGENWPWLSRFTFRDRTWHFSRRQIATLVEPAVFFFPGLMLWAVGQHLGELLMGASIIYSLSYVAAYEMGRDFLLDQIDQQLCQSHLGDTMSEGLAPNFTQGVSFPGELPTDPEQRRRLAPAFMGGEDIAYPIR